MWINEENEPISRQMGTKRSYFTLKVGGTVALCHPDWPCHPEERGSEDFANQKCGTGALFQVARPCHFNSRPFIAFWRWNSGVFASTFLLLSKVAILGFLGLVLLPLNSKLGIEFSYAFGRLLLQIIQSILFFPLFYVLIRVSYFLACVCSWLRF